MALRTPSPNDTDYNPAQENYEGKVDSAYIAKGLQDAENYAQGGGGEQTADSVEESESEGTQRSPGGWGVEGFDQPATGNNGGRLAAVGKFFKNKGAIGGIIALVGGGGGIAMVAPGFLGPNIVSQAFTRFANSVGIVGAADDSAFAVKLFGGDTLRTTCVIGRISCTFDGVTANELEAIKATGAKLTPEGGVEVPNSDGKRFTFEKIELNGVELNARNIHSKMKNPLIANKLKPLRQTALTKAARNAAQTKALKTMGVSRDPKIAGATIEELEDSMYKQVHPDSNANSVGADVNEDKKPDAEADPEGSASYEAGAVGVETGSADLSAKIAEEEARAARREFTHVKPQPLDDTYNALTSEGKYGSVEETKSAMGKAWGWINSLDIADAVCTTYQIGNLAVVLARTVTLMNIVRYGYVFLSLWQKQQAGEATGDEINQLTSLITTRNQNGDSFDSSPGMQFLMNGTISTTNSSSITARGGETLQAIATLITGVNSFAGAGNARQGKYFAQTLCGLATNLAVQVGATVTALAVDIVATVFTGGGWAAAKASATVGFKAGLKQGGKILANQVKELVEKSIFKEVKTIATKGINKEERQLAIRAVRKEIKRTALDPLNSAGLLLVIVETFGMEYIVNSLSGMDTIAMMRNSSQSAEAIVTAASTDDYLKGIAMGGSVQSISQYSSYVEQNNVYVARSVEAYRDEANPLDISNPYSTLGSFVSSFMTTMGSIVNSSSLLTSTLDMLRVPGSALTRFSTSLSVSAADKATPQQLADYVNDPYMQEKGLAVDIVGNPQIGADLGYFAANPPNVLLEYAITQNWINPDGSIREGDDNAYADHFNNCNNPARYLLDENNMPDAYIQPAYCQDNTDQRKMLNAITTYRSLYIGSGVAF